jgi:hypothetical protein
MEKYGDRKDEENMSSDIGAVSVAGKRQAMSAARVAF